MAVDIATIHIAYNEANRNILVCTQPSVALGEHNTVLARDAEQATCADCRKAAGLQPVKPPLSDFAKDMADLDAIDVAIQGARISANLQLAVLDAIHLGLSLDVVTRMLTEVFQQVRTNIDQVSKTAAAKAFETRPRG